MVEGLELLIFFLFFFTYFIRENLNKINIWKWRRFDEIVTFNFVIFKFYSFCKTLINFSCERKVSKDFFFSFLRVETRWWKDKTANYRYIKKNICIKIRVEEFHCHVCCDNLINLQYNSFEFDFSTIYLSSINISYQRDLKICISFQGD